MAERDVSEPGAVATGSSRRLLKMKMISFQPKQRFDPVAIAPGTDTRLKEMSE